MSSRHETAHILRTEINAREVHALSIRSGCGGAAGTVILRFALAFLRLVFLILFVLLGWLSGHVAAEAVRR